MKKSCISLVALMASGLVSDSFATAIGTAELFVSSLADDPAGEYTLTADIDLSDAGYTTIAEFSGTLDGAGHTLSGLATSQLFGTVTGTVKNLIVDGTVEDANTSVSAGNTGFAPLANILQGGTVENCQSKGYTISTASKGASASALVRIAKDGAVIRGCVIDASVKVSGNINTTVGGIVASVSMTTGFSGDVAATFDSCINRATLSVTSSSYNTGLIGGIIGTVNAIDTTPVREVIVSNCQNEGPITGVDKTTIGGLVGSLSGTGTSGSTRGQIVTFIGCTNNGTISGTGDTCHMGGFLGSADVGASVITFSNCVNRAAITGTGAGRIGGIIAYHNNPNQALATRTLIINCANYGTLTGSHVGGLVGEMSVNNGWNCGKYYFRNSGNFGDIMATDAIYPARMTITSGQLYGCFSGTSGMTVKIEIENCWMLNGQYGGASSSRLANSAAFISSVDPEYSNASALSSLNGAVTADNGFCDWVQGRYYPELEPFASEATAGKVDVIFREWNGNCIAVDAVDSGSPVTPPADPERSGFTFLGWSPSDLFSVSAPTPVTATYEVESHTITFDTQGGGAGSSITADTLTDLELPADPVRSGYFFKGWSLDRAKVETLPDCMTAEDRTYYALWKPASVEDYHSSFTFVQWKSTTGNSDDYFNAMNSVLGATDADIISFDDFKSVTYTAKLSVAGYSCAAKSFNGSSDGNVRMVCWKTSKFGILSDGMLGTTGKPQSNMSVGYVVLEELATGNQFLIFNAWAGTTKSINGYNSSIPAFISGITVNYPAATVIWAADCSGQAKRSEYPTDYESDYQKVADEFMDFTKLNGIQVGSDFQWTFIEVVPTSFSVTALEPDNVFAKTTGYKTSFQFGSASKPSGLIILFQ